MSMSEESASFVLIHEDGVFDHYSPFQHGWFSLNCVIVMWLLAHLTTSCLTNMDRYNIKTLFRELEEDRQKTLVVHVLRTIITTIAFILQIYGSTHYLFQLKDSTTSHQLNWSFFAAQSIVVLYIWEIIYRKTIRWARLTHFVAVLVLLQMSIAAYYDSSDMIYLRFITLVGMFATTEQMSSVATFFYTLDLFTQRHATLFKLAAYQALISKTIIAAVSILYYSVSIVMGGKFEDNSTTILVLWKFLFLPTISLLFGVEIYTVQKLHALSEECRAREERRIRALMERACLRLIPATKKLSIIQEAADEASATSHDDWDSDVEASSVRSP